MYAFFPVATSAQDGIAKEAPFRRFPRVPPLTLLLTDSSSIFTKEQLAKKKAILIMLFDPGCDHCQQKTAEITQFIDKLEKVQIVLSTNADFRKMKDFYDRYRLGQFSNIVVGKDINFLLPPFYEARHLPFLAFYNRKRELISVFEGAMPFEQMLAELKK